MPIYDIEPIDYNLTWNNDITKEEVIKHVNDHFKIKYFLHWKEHTDLNGLTFIYTHSVFLRKDMNPTQLGVTLAHELCHIKYWSANEAFVEFMAFKELYESNDTLLLYLAKYMIVIHCDIRAYKNTAYDIGYQILNYLENI